MGNEALSHVLPTWVSQSRQLYLDKKLFDTALHTLSLSIIDPYGADQVSSRHGPGIQEPSMFSSTIWSRHTGWLEWCHIVHFSLLSMVCNERVRDLLFPPALGVIEAKQGWVKRSKPNRDESRDRTWRRPHPAWWASGVSIPLPPQVMWSRQYLSSSRPTKVYLKETQWSGKTER